MDDGHDRSRASSTFDKRCVALVARAKIRQQLDKIVGVSTRVKNSVILFGAERHRLVDVAAIGLIKGIELHGASSGRSRNFAVALHRASAASSLILSERSITVVGRTRT